MSGLLGFGRDTLQSASNAIAGNVSGPVDLINMGLLSLGLPMPANPVGGSRWMAERGLTREVADPYARAAGETLGLVGPMVAAAKAPQIAEGLLNHADAYRRYHAATAAPGAPATVWHGSRHLFPPEPGAPLGRFRADKIGTGEGAQAQGHGFYLAGRRETGNSYRTAGSAAYANNRVQELADRAFDVSGGDKKAALAWLNKRATELPLEQQYMRQMYFDAINNFDEVRTAGHLYKVDLPDDAIAKMLNWDKPLSRQPANVQKAWAEISGRLGAPVDPNDLVGITATRSMLEDQLSQRGVPGIRYLDGGSRSAGAGTSNYVVFPGNENLLTILSRE